MRRSLFLLSLLAAIPSLGSAQEPKLVNCRTLEAAGNFVGPDEVIVDDMVCQKAKPGTDAAKSQQPPKPVIGTTISDTPAESVVDAAKAAEKRIASRKEKEEAAAQKTAAETSSVAGPATTPHADPAPTAPARVAESTTPPPAPAPVKIAASVATPPEESAPAAPAPTPSVTAVAPASVAASKSVPPQPIAPEATPSAPAEPRPAENEIVISSAPSSTPATTSPAAERNASPPPAEVAAAPSPTTPPATPPTAEPVPASAADMAAPPPRPAETLPPPDPMHPATSSGFYDANAPKRSVNATPQTHTGFATAEQVNAGLTPGATSIPPASSQPAITEAATPAPEPEPQHGTIAAARVAFDDPDRDRSVKLGDFAQPKEVAPDPGAEHRTSVDPSDVDGFQDRQRPECTKNITLGGLKGERLVLGVPTWAAKWIEKNEKRMPEICFSETPMKTARNYLVVFSTPAGATNGKDVSDAVLNPEKGSTVAGVGTFTTSFGSTWHYSYDRNVGTTVLTQDDADEPHGQPGQVLYATAYTEEGVPVSQRWPAQAKKELKAGEKNPKRLKGEREALEHVSDDLLSQMVDDIAKF